MNFVYRWLADGSWHLLDGAEKTPEKSGPKQGEAVERRAADIQKVGGVAVSIASGVRELNRHVEEQQGLPGRSCQEAAHTKPDFSVRLGHFG